MLLCKPAKKCLHSWTLTEDMRCAKQGRASPRSWALLEPCSHLSLLTSSGKQRRQGSGEKHFPGPHVHLVAACKHPKSFVQSDLNLLKLKLRKLWIFVCLFICSTTMMMKWRMRMWMNVSLRRNLETKVAQAQEPRWHLRMFSPNKPTSHAWHKSQISPNQIK